MILFIVFIFLYILYRYFKKNFIKISLLNDSNLILYFYKNDRFNKEINPDLKIFLKKKCLDNLKENNDFEVEFFNSKSTKHIYKIKKKSSFFLIEETTLVNQYKNESIENLNLLKNFLNYLPDAVGVFDNSYRCIFYNDGFYRLWKLDKNFIEKNNNFLHIDLINNIINKNLISPKNVNSFREWHMNIKNIIKESYNEFFHLNDGRMIRMLILPNNKNNMIFLYQDISDRLKIRMELNFFENLLWEIINFSQIPVILLKNNLNIFLYNKSIAKIINYENFISEDHDLYNFFNNFKYQITNLNYFLQKLNNFYNDYLSRNLNLFLEILDKERILLNINLIKLSNNIIYMSINSDILNFEFSN